MKKIVSIFLFLSASFSATMITAAPPVVNATIEPTQGLIGDKFTLSVKVEKDIMQVVEFPSFENREIATNIELLNEYAPDTLAVTGRRIILSKRYEMTSFDEGGYILGQFPVLYMDKNLVDTLLTADTLRFEVRGFEIDTATQTIYDIKPIEQTPLLFGEFQGYLLMVVLVGLTIAAVIIMVSRYMARRKGRIVHSEKPQEPPHIMALRALEALYGQKLWQAGKVKLYHTTLTDILRRYLGERYDIDAMENTTDEILAQMSELSKDNFANLRQILQLADMVKFAKGVPTEDENEQVWHDTYKFVEDTKEELMVEN